MKKYLLIIVLLNLHNLFGQLVIPYLDIKPKIDGHADPFLSEFELCEFNEIYKSRTSNRDAQVKYYTAYNSNFLYLYIVANADRIVKRDRAYQNGDGFHLMLGKTQKNNKPTDEFYILGFSPQKSWCHKMIWYYNIELSMKKLGDMVEFETSENKGKISFELMLPWKAVPPYHPWIDDEIGFNLCFVKAIGLEEKNYYFVKYDKKMQGEQSKREYISLNFANPFDRTSFYIQPIKSNLAQNSSPGIRIAGYSNKDTSQKLIAKIRSGENFDVFRKSYKVKIPTGKFEKKVMFDEAELIPGGYQVSVKSANGNEFEHFISVFPQIDFQEYKTRIRNLSSGISEGSYNTIMFYIQTLEREVKELKDYETSFKIRKKINQLDQYLEQLQKGRDPFKNKTGVYRRAYVSKIDSSLRPYSIYIPENYSKDREYPLLIYLHGSGDDDRVLVRTPKISDGYIMLAPNGRGTSNCFATQDAQTDIVESINDVINNFKIDSENIVLSGFSMGGYGVYRTYYDHPDLFKAVAIISGHPNLAQKWQRGDQVNFLKYQNMKSFRETPMFIFHGRKDRNCPFEITEKLVQKLKQKGHNVSFIISDSGHGNMSKAAQEKYRRWLEEQIGN